MLNRYFVDLHIHIGAAKNGQPVKITASKKLNFANILKESRFNKGLNMVGIIDCASPIVLEDIDRLLDAGEMEELPEGGIKYGDLVIILGTEVESREKNGGQAHYLAYFPYLKNIKEYSLIMKQYITNINLSSQSTGLGGKEILQLVDLHDGIMLPAHVFTPYKSFYGRSFSSYKEVFTEEEWNKIPAIELGLSADTYLADYLKELSDKTYISNSDAHSLIKIAREYNVFEMEALNYQEFKKALYAKEKRGVVANYGLDPRLGKYHRSFCPDCNKQFSGEKAILRCEACGSKDIVIGVKDRIIAISDQKSSKSPSTRAEYIHQIPLADIPGVGKKTYQKLLDNFSSEMNIIHKTSEKDLLKVLRKKTAKNIIEARSGKISIKVGGGGHYGKVMG
ncbi:endonuclease Q family protein [Natronospora cellulosivora (SeqCode)]